MSSAGVEFLVGGFSGLVKGLRSVGGVNVLQQRDDVGVPVADAAHLEEVLVDVDDVQAIFPDAHLAELAQLGAGPLQKRQGGLQTAGGVVVSRKGCSHDWGRRMGR